MFFTVCDAISSNTPTLLFGDFNIHHKDWLTYSDGTYFGFFSNTSNCSSVTSFPLQNSELLSQFPMSPFHCMADDYFCGDWDSLHDHLRDIFW